MHAPHPLAPPLNAIPSAYEVKGFPAPTSHHILLADLEAMTEGPKTPMAPWSQGSNMQTKPEQPSSSEAPV